MRNRKHGFRLTLPESDWVFRTDRMPLEVTDAEYFIYVSAVKGRRSERRHLARVLKRLEKRTNLAVGLARIETVEGRSVLRYYSQSIVRSRGRPTSSLEWNYRTCIDVPRSMYELHLIRRRAPGPPLTRSDSKILRIVRSLRRDTPPN